MVRISEIVRELRQMSKELQGRDVYFPDGSDMIAEGEHDVGKLLHYIADMLEI